MIQGARRDIVADRWVPFTYSIDVLGMNLTGATLRAQVRLYNDASGAALVDMAQVGDASTGVRFLGVNITGQGVVSTIQLQIALAAISALPEAAEAGDDVDFAWDLIVTPAGGIAGRWLFGTFTVRAGVTH